jgi:hypothetical protein
VERLESTAREHFPGAEMGRDFAVYAVPLTDQPYAP